MLPRCAVDVAIVCAWLLCVHVSAAGDAIDATYFRSRVCAMAWRFHAIDATLSQ